MDIINELLKEMDAEASTTRKMLALVPADRFGWQPHAKSMTLQQLATHLAEIPGWVGMAVYQDSVNFDESAFVPRLASTSNELLAIFEKSLAEGRAALEKLTPDALDKPWQLKGGDAVFLDTTKYGMVRHAFSQTIHHRAQLGVYLRLLDIPIPGSYGPSADEM